MTKISKCTKKSLTKKSTTKKSTTKKSTTKKSTTKKPPTNKKTVKKEKNHMKRKPIQIGAGKGQTDLGQQPIHKIKKPFKDTGADAGIELVARIDTGLGAGVGAGSGAGPGTGLGAGPGAGSRSGAGAGAGAGLEIVSDSETDLDSDQDQDDYQIIPIQKQSTKILQSPSMTSPIVAKFIDDNTDNISSQKIYYKYYFYNDEKNKSTINIINEKIIKIVRNIIPHEKGEIIQKNPKINELIQSLKELFKINYKPIEKLIQKQQEKEYYFNYMEYRNIVKLIEQLQNELIIVFDTDNKPKFVDKSHVKLEQFYFDCYKIFKNIIKSIKQDNDAKLRRKQNVPQIFYTLLPGQKFQNSV